MGALCVGPVSCARGGAGLGPRKRRQREGANRKSWRAGTQVPPGKKKGLWVSRPKPKPVPRRQGFHAVGRQVCRTIAFVHRSLSPGCVHHTRSPLRGAWARRLSTSTHSFVPLFF
ncbi:hypothetical protein PVAP13_5NG074581 [Panicum virgatum]|uniref:Uncharacterized protein n=1 Tax=Panicum virgatum TaxID=38727 RepID=A0A8T0RNG9_PANVG|nr:hypothetical protein PVAP13_5NG074581 [Panicum virgatum]